MKMMKAHELVMGLVILAIMAVALNAGYSRVTARVNHNDGDGYALPVSTPIGSTLCARPSDCSYPLLYPTQTSRGLVVPVLPSAR